MAKLKAEGKTTAPAPCYPFIAWVFNLDQTEGLERPADDVPAAKNYPLEEAEKIVAGMPKPPEIHYGASLNPCYKTMLYVVEMPNMGQFEDGEHFYAALLMSLSLRQAIHPALIVSRRRKETAKSATVMKSLWPSLEPRSFPSRAASITPHGLTMRCLPCRVAESTSGRSGAAASRGRCRPACGRFHPRQGVGGGRAGRRVRPEVGPNGPAQKTSRAAVGLRPASFL